MVSPTIETPRALSRTSCVRCAEWDSVCGTHQGQRSNAPRKQAGHKTASGRTPLTKNVLLCRSYTHRTKRPNADAANFTNFYHAKHRSSRGATVCFFQSSRLFCQLLCKRIQSFATSLQSVNIYSKSQGRLSSSPECGVSLPVTICSTHRKSIRPLRK